MKRNSGLALYIALCGAVACGERQDRAADANVAVVESAAPRWAVGSGWSLSAEPAARIGGEEEGDTASQLTSVAGAVRLGDGRLVVADPGAPALRFFAADGRLLQSAGRKGSGPGEFQGLDALIRLRGDSLLAWDRASARASVFDETGTFVRTFRLEGVDALPTLVGVLPDGGLVATGGIRPMSTVGASGSERRDSITLLHFDRQGALRDTIGRFAGPETYVDVGQGAMTFEAIVFGRDTRFAVGRGRLFAAENAGVDVAEIEPTGKMVRRIRREVEPRAASRTDVERYREYLLSRDLSGVPAQLRAAATRRVNTIPHRETLPALEEMRVDDDGNLWVQRYQVPGTEPGEWDVFDADGGWLGTVRTPAGFRVTEIGRDYLLGVAKGELGVEAVHLYHLNRG